MEHTTIQAFCAALSSDAPTPGGGGASALAGALAASLAHMAAALTVDKKRFEAHRPALEGELARLSTLRERMLGQICRDADEFAALMGAYALPSTTQEEKHEKQRAVQAGLARAAQPPLEVLALCRDVARSLAALAPITSPHVVSDVGCAAALCAACAQAALLNVLVNAASMRERTAADALVCEAQGLCAAATEAAQTIYEEVRTGLCKGC